MATISSSGIGSGLPVESLVSQLMAVERLPVTALDKKEAANLAKLSAIGTLKSSLASLQTAAKALSTPAQLSPTKASVATPSVLSATTASGAAAGSYNIEVQSLAQPQKLIAATGYTATSEVVGTGEITLDFGSYDNAVPPVFSAQAGSSSKKITIDAAHNTLAGVRDAINSASAGVTASIINDGTKNYLSLTSTSTGASNAMQISVNDPSLAGLAYDGQGTAGNMGQIVAPKDAVIIVDSVKITKPSNTISDSIQGVTLNLTDTTAPGVTTKLTLTRDTAGVQTNIEAFVKAYNATTKAMADATAFDTSTGKGAVLNGDSTIRSIQTQLRQIMGASVPGAAAGTSTLSSVGITSAADGSLTIDATKLSAALGDPAKNFTALFATSGTNRGYGSQLDFTLGRILSPVGQLPTHANSINDTITGIGKQRDTLNARLVSIEARYRAQFSALDKAMSSMTSTSNFLTQQLTALSKSTA